MKPYELGACNVLSKISRLFDHYCEHHYVVYAPGFPIIDAEGRKLGQVERICYGRTSLRLEGWSIADKIAIGGAGVQNWQTPDILRTDVNAAMGLAAARRTGFNLSWFGGSYPVLLSLRIGKSTLQIMCPEVRRITRAKSHIHIRISFAKDMLRAAPALVRALASPTVVNRLRAKRALGMEHRQISNILDARVFEKCATPRSKQKLTIIMPVFNA
ncbi:MAG: hypothetical protein WBC85_07290, partial [Planktotalea sp.]|uniref:hypothetical protein n=1 Tax=Planktotalea sp. TaxID=2029877 RepID=UPI003C748303